MSEMEVEVKAATAPGTTEFTMGAPNLPKGVKGKGQRRPPHQPWGHLSLPWGTGAREVPVGAPNLTWGYPCTCHGGTDGGQACAPPLTGHEGTTPRHAAAC